MKENDGILSSCFKPQTFHKLPSQSSVYHLLLSLSILGSALSYQSIQERGVKVILYIWHLSPEIWAGEERCVDTSFLRVGSSHIRKHQKDVVFSDLP